jgi:hypothetical protein
LKKRKENEEIEEKGYYKKQRQESKLRDLKKETFVASYFSLSTSV